MNNKNYQAYNGLAPRSASWSTKPVVRNKHTSYWTWVIFVDTEYEHSIAMCRVDSPLVFKKNPNIYDSMGFTGYPSGLKPVAWDFQCFADTL